MRQKFAINVEGRAVVVDVREFAEYAMIDFYLFTSRNRDEKDEELALWVNPLAALRKILFACKHIASENLGKDIPRFVITAVDWKRIHVYKIFCQRVGIKSEFGTDPYDPMLIVEST